MAYSRGNNTNIIVGAAAFFVADAPLSADAGVGTGGDNSYPPVDAGESYKDTLTYDGDFRNVGYTSNGLEVMFEPDFGEVSVDQVLDVAKLYKQGMKVSMKTSFAEATLENLLVALDYSSTELDQGELNMSSGDIGE